MKIGTIAGGIGVSTTIQIEWCPQIINFLTTATPTSMLVNVLGDGVVTNLSALGIAALSRTMKTGNVTNLYSIACADGIVLGKTTTVTIVNATADAFDLYAYGEIKASRYWESLTQLVLANSGTVLTDFFELALPSFVVADQLTVTYQQGFQQSFAPQDLRVNCSYTTYVAGDASDLRLSNAIGLVKTAYFIPAASQNVFCIRQRVIGNLT